MRKVLLSILLVLLIILLGYTIIEGQEIGSLSIWGVQEIDEQDQKIESRIATFSTLSSSTYSNSMDNLENNASEMKNKKNEYENTIALAMSDENNYAIRTEKYPLEFLWTKLGNYATSEGVDLTITVETSSNGADLYDLNFKLVSDFIGATEFIYDIENDSSLGFKIDNFNMVKYYMSTGKGDGITSDNYVETTFICKDINIDIDKSMLAINNISNVDTSTSTIVNSTNDSVTTENNQ